MIIFIVLSLSLVANIVFCHFLYKAIKRLLEFDDLYELLAHDIETNVVYFTKLVDTPLLANAPEILEAQRNMRTIRDRMNEYISRMEEISQRKLKKSNSKDISAKF